MFPERLKKLRLEKELTQDELGKILNYGRTAISGYELGRNRPSHEVLCKFADFFDVSVDYLLCKTDSIECAVIDGDDVPQPLRDIGIHTIEILKEAKEAGLSENDIAEILEFHIKQRKKQNK